MGAGDGNVIEQAEWVAPAVSGEVLVIGVDATSREYDLSLVDLGAAFARHPEAKFYITATADGGAVYYTMSAASGKTVDNTAALTAGNAIAGFTANGAGVIFASTAAQIYIDRTQHRYLQIKTASSTAKLRINLSSNLRPGDQ